MPMSRKERIITNIVVAATVCFVGYWVMQTLAYFALINM